MLTAAGIGSGLDINGMVSQLVAAERANVDAQIKRESSEVAANLSAFGQLQGAVSSLQGSLGGLAKLANYDKTTAGTSNGKAISVSSDSSAVPNQYQVSVTQLADSHSLASMAFDDKDETALGSGSLTLRFGTTDYDSDSATYKGFELNGERAAVTLAIGSDNNTLEGIMNTINGADAGVRASIVNDGSGYRLLLAGEDTGAANGIEISVSDDDGDDADALGLSRFSFNAQAAAMAQTNAAADARFTINGLAVSSASNTVSSVIDGVSLSLKELTEDPVSVEIGEDSATVVNALSTFINGYNRFTNSVNQLTGYDADRRVAGLLMGDFTVRSIKSQVDNILRNAVNGLDGDFTNLFELGISTGDNGTLSLDKSKFEEVLAAKPAEVKAIFAALGAPTDEDLYFESSSDATTSGDYAVEITSLASAGVYTGASVLPDFAGGASLVIDADNDTFSLSVDGVDAGEVTLTHGSYASGASLAAEIQARINGADTLREAGVSASVLYDAASASLSIESAAVGSSSSVNLSAVDSASAARLGLSVADGTAGTDVAGSIGGVNATGQGKVLSGAEGSATEGLGLRIEGGVTGSRGSVAFTRGLADQLNRLLQQVLDEDGAIESRISNLEQRADAVEERKEQMELRWEVVEERYRRQFNQLDRLLAELQSTGSYLEAQLATLPGPRKAGGK